MTTDEILEKLTALIHQHVEDPSAPISRSTHLQDDLGMDSLTRVDIVVEIEALFDIVVPDGSLPQLKRVGDIVDFVEGTVQV